MSSQLFCKNAEIDLRFLFHSGGKGRTISIIVHISLTNQEILRFSSLINLSNASITVTVIEYQKNPVFCTRIVNTDKRAHVIFAVVLEDEWGLLARYTNFIKYSHKSFAIDPGVAHPLADKISCKTICLDAF